MTYCSNTLKFQLFNVSFYVLSEIVPSTRLMIVPLIHLFPLLPLLLLKHINN